MHDFGRAVYVDIYEAGPPNPRRCFTVKGYVLNSSSEVDVILERESAEEYEYEFKRQDCPIEDLKEGDLYVLRNCQHDQVRVR